MFNTYSTHSFECRLPDNMQFKVLHTKTWLQSSDNNGNILCSDSNGE